MEIKVDTVSGIRYVEQVWATEETEIRLEAIEDDGVTFAVTSNVHDEDGLDDLIAKLEARRADLRNARRFAG